MVCLRNTLAFENICWYIWIRFLFFFGIGLMSLSIMRQWTVLWVIVIVSGLGFWLMMRMQGPSDLILPWWWSDASSLSIDRDELQFAGEAVPAGSRYRYIRERLEREITLNLLNMDQLIMIAKRRDTTVPMIQQWLREAWIPADFVYLVIAESALRTTAVSTAGAAGLRQLMPDTARGRGLRVDGQIDERLDRSKSMQVWIGYLKDLYAQFGNWTLAAAAYNRGHNGLARDMQRQQQSWYYDLWLNDETSRYVFRILALKIIFEHREQLIDPMMWWDWFTLPTTKTVTVQWPIWDLAGRARSQGSTYIQLRLLNPWIVDTSLPAGDWEVVLVK
jgi:hypothetical protein